jgi:hypothetical protein
VARALKEPARMKRLAFLILALGCSANNGSISDPSFEPAAAEDAGAPETEVADSGSVEDADAAPVEPEWVPVKDLAIDQIALFQAVKLPLEKDGKKVESNGRAQVIAGRAAIVRVYVSPAETFAPREVDAELTLEGATTKVFHGTRTISGASSEDDLDSTINVELPAGAIEKGARYRVRLLTKRGQSAGTVANAAYPADDSLDDLDVIDTGTFKLKLVPVKANGYLPDTSEEQIARYRSILEAMYPTTKIELTVRDVYDYGGYIGPRGVGISTLLGSVQSLRKKDGAPADVYYYGLVAPTSSRSTYCAGGCTTGICSVPGPEDTFLRACVGVGFTGTSSAGTLAHELGHAHGIYHAPCGGASGPDSKFPYSGGKTGVWGLDVRTSKLIDPSKTFDVMGYCSPEWISDYAFGKIARRMNTLANEASIVGGVATTYRFAVVSPSGELSWGDEITLDEPMFGEPHTIRYPNADGSGASVTGFYYPFAEEGGQLLVPQLPIGARDIAVAGFGVERHLPSL